MDVVVVERGGGFSVRLTAVAIYCVPQAGHTIVNSVCSQSWYQTGLLIKKLCAVSTLAECEAFCDRDDTCSRQACWSESCVKARNPGYSAPEVSLDLQSQVWGIWVRLGNL